MVRSGRRTAGDSMNQITRRITAEVSALLETQPFHAWAEDQKLQSGDLIILNNSFLFRDGIRTTRKTISISASPSTTQESVRFPPWYEATRAST